MRSHASWLAAVLVTACASDHPATLHATDHGAGAKAPQGPFLATSERSFQDLMDEAMARMHAGMEGAPRTGDPDRDFVTQMIPHHQGAIDMAKALLVHGKDPALQRLAKEIITDQRSEIDLMRAWLEAHPTPPAPTRERP
jgi:uncharacterized protein (DUF305 family)